MSKVGEAAAAAAAKSLQSCLTLCDPRDSSPPGSPVPGILQARTLEWVAISFSNAWKWKVKVKLLSRVRLLATPWTAAHQAPPSMGFSRGEDWSGVPLPSPGDAALSSNKTWDWKQETEPCFPMYLLGSPICCVNLIKFHHLSGGVKVGVSLQEVRMVLLWGDGEHPLLVVLTFHFCSKHQVQL